jgi:L-alanine-DL-glutamate epimerase-like enolase superfamily enzyme
MTLSLVAVVTDVVRDGRRVVGYGFNSNGRYGQGGLIRERFAPRILEATPETLIDAAGDNLDPHKIWAAAMKNEKPGGHGERSVAVGTIDMAVWDAVAKIAGKPLFRLLAERYGGTADPRVFVYAAGGYYYPGKGVEQLRAEMRSYLDRGYTVVKMKIGNGIGEDAPRIEGVLTELDGKARLAVDANGRLGLEDAIAYAKMLREYPLFWYEEAGDPLDFALQAALAEFYPGPMATGENLFSHQDARNLLRYGGMRPDRDWLQFDCALSYGLVEYLRTLDALKVAGWSPRRCVPHGGHQMSLNIAAGLGLGGNESYPDLFQPYGGFPDGVRVEDGHIVMPELPGIGFEGKSDLIKVMRELAE